LNNLNPWTEEELYRQSLVCLPRRRSSKLYRAEELVFDDTCLLSAASCSDPNNVSTWGIAEVGSWLESIGADCYKPKFENEKVDGKQLLKLNEGQLLVMGIMKQEHRKRLMKSIHYLTRPHTKKIPPRMNDESG